MILYIPIWIIQFSSIGGKKAFGLVLEAAMEKPIDLALVRLFDSQTNRLVHTVASDMKGHYSVLVKNGKYQIRCQKSGYIMDKPINKEITKGLAALSDTIKMRTENGNIPVSSISDNAAVNNANINLDLSNIQN